MWYDMTPKAYAATLRFHADESDARAAYWEARLVDAPRGSPAARQAEYMADDRRANSKRLREWASRLDVSPCAKAGDACKRGGEPWKPGEPGAPVA